MPIAAINSSVWMSNLNQLSVDEREKMSIKTKTKTKTNKFLYPWEHVAATATPLANIITKVASFNQEHQKISFSIFTLNPTEERTTSLNVHDMLPSLNWVNFTQTTPDEEDVVDKTNYEDEIMRG